MSLRDREFRYRQERLELEADLSAYADTSDPFSHYEPCRVPTPCTVPAVPGNAAEARRAGCEDEYDNQMEARYGENL